MCFVFGKNKHDACVCLYEKISVFTKKGPCNMIVCNTFLIDLCFFFFFHFYTFLIKYECVNLLERRKFFSALYIV